MRKSVFHDQTAEPMYMKFSMEIVEDPEEPWLLLIH